MRATEGATTYLWEGEVLKIAQKETRLRLNKIKVELKIVPFVWRRSS